MRTCGLRAIDFAAREKILPWIAEYSPYALVSRDDRGEGVDWDADEAARWRATSVEQGAAGAANVENCVYFHFFALPVFKLAV